MTGMGNKDWLRTFLSKPAGRKVFAEYNYNDQVKEVEMGRECSMHGGGRGMHTGFRWQGQKERDH